MDLLLLSMRVVHVGLGVFWVGALLLNTFFVGPAMAEAGPEGAKVGMGLMRRRLTDVLPAVAILTVLSGYWLYWRASLGFQPEYMGSGPGMAYGIGAVTATIALIIGLAVIRPSMLGAMSLSQKAAAAAGEREQLLTQAQRLRVRAAQASLIVAWLLIITTVTMAIGRYT